MNEEEFMLSITPDGNAKELSSRGKNSELEFKNLKEDNSSGKLDISSTNISQVCQSGVIMRVLHTRTEIKIYPGGNVFQKSTSWFEDKTYTVKPKPKKVAKVAQKVLVGKEENY